VNLCFGDKNVFSTQLRERGRRKKELSLCYGKFTSPLVSIMLKELFPDYHNHIEKELFSDFNANPHKK
jgi:hypothetical protein